MTDKIAINGTFSDLKSVKTRSVVQMIVEVPIEQAARIVELFGFPQPGREIPVTVFRPAPAPQEPAGKLVVPKPRRPFHDLPASQQAALACQRLDFQKWVAEKHGSNFAPPEDTPEMLRNLLGISSRAELDKNGGVNRASTEWRNLYADFEQDSGRVAVPR